MENGTFAPQKQMFNSSKYFPKSYISKASQGACVELRVKVPLMSTADYYLHVCLQLKCQ